MNSGTKLTILCFPLNQSMPQLCPQRTEGHCCAYHHMFDVIRTHPSAQGHGSERWLEAVHVEQEGAIVTLDKRGHATTPAKKRYRPFLWQGGRIQTNSALWNSFPSLILTMFSHTLLPNNPVTFTIRKMDEVGGYHQAPHYSLS